jgi:WD40 repeat protein
MARVLLAELIARGVRVESHEAVAIAQQLIQRGAVAPAPHNVRLATEGIAECAGCDATPGVYEIAIFLQTLLPSERVGVPGGLRYTIARGLHEVEARPFDSIDELAAALQRFEKGDRRSVVGQLVRREIRLKPVAPVAEFPLEPAAAQVAEFPPVRAAAQVADMPLTLAAAPAADIALTPPHAMADLSFTDVPYAAAAAHVPAPQFLEARVARPASTWRTLGSVAAALVICAAGGFTGVRLWTTARHAPVAHQAVAQAEPVRITPPPAVGSRPSGRAQMSAPAPSVAGPTRRLAPRQQARAGDAVAVAAVDTHRTPVFSPAFASNGSALFFHTGGSHDERSAIAVSNNGAPYGLEVMTIVDDGARNYHVQPSPDGRTIAFDSDRDGERGVYIAKRDGTDVRRISGDGYAAVPTWSPDGRRLAYIRAEASNPNVWNLWVQSLDDGHVTRLTNYRYGQTWSASWFPDGQRICYSHEDKLVIASLDTGREQVFASPVKGRLVRTPAVSPDGTKVIFQVFRQGAWMLNVGDGSMQFVLTDPTAEEFAWAPDGRHVAFHSRRDGAWGIYVIAG